MFGGVYAHDTSKRKWLVTFLQKKGIILSPEFHKQHHLLLNCNYCVYHGHGEIFVTPLIRSIFKSYNDGQTGKFVDFGNNPKDGGSLSVCKILNKHVRIIMCYAAIILKFIQDCTNGLLSVNHTQFIETNNIRNWSAVNQNILYYSYVILYFSATKLVDILICV